MDYSRCIFELRKKHVQSSNLDRVYGSYTIRSVLQQLKIKCSCLIVDRTYNTISLSLTYQETETRNREVIHGLLIVLLE